MTNPQKIGRYEIKSELGRGGMATVYKAYDPRFEREVALKVLPREMMHDGNFRMRFEREAKTIARLEHPAIVPVYDVGEEDGQPYFVMRCMSGGSLADRIARGAMSIKEAAKIMERLSPALDEAHAKGIIHRDLKPGNILFDTAGEPYISDFGIAKITQSQTSTMTGGAIIGTPAYMSPEQAQGEQVDGRSDIYALGVIIYEMLTGTQPYQATTPMAVVIKHITEPIPHILDVSPNLPVAIEAVIEKALAKNRDERFTSAAELAAALGAVATGTSGDEALKTATLVAVRVREEKTRAIAEKTRLAQKEKKGLSPLVFIIPAAGLVGIVILAVAGYFIFGRATATPTPAPTIPPNLVTAPTESPTVTAEPTFTPIPPTAVPPTPIPPTAAPTQTSAPVVPTSVPPTPTPKAIGGVDKVAFIANNEIWLMNIDGSDRKVLTNDKAPKTDLQWVPGTDNQLVYISGKSIGIVNTDSGAVDIITTFPSGSSSLETFHISPDAKQVAISLNNELYVVPFDLEKLRAVHSRSGLIAMKGCISHTGRTLAANRVKEFRWGSDPNMISWLFSGTDVSSGKSADLIQLVRGFASCDPTKLFAQDEFPATRFTPEDYTNDRELPDFDWNGGEFFVFNTLKRNQGWGYLYSYDATVHKGFKLDVFGSNVCCYRDARLNQDGTYIFFAFQDEGFAPAFMTRLYYIPIGQIGVVGYNPSPLPLPEDFFRNGREGPQPALHFVKKP